MFRRTLFAAAISVVFLFTPATEAAELVTNGSFETGNFTGWTAVNAPNPWYPWQVVAAGFNNGFSQSVSPQDGSRVAYQGVASNPGTFSLTQQVTIPAGTAALFWKHRFQLDHVNFCSGSTCGTATYRVDILNTSDAVLANIFIMTVNPGQNVNTGWQNLGVSMNAFAGQTIKIRFSTTVTATYAGPGQLEIDQVSLQAPYTVSSAPATISGRVSDQYGKPITNALINVADPDGGSKTAHTNSFGNFTVEGLEAGRSYIISVSHRRYRFAETPRIIELTESIGDLSFVASP